MDKIETLKHLLIINNLSACQGKYCGRTNNKSECSACPWGSRLSPTPLLHTRSMCEPCLTSMQFYDWLYLGFMFSLPVLFILFNLTNEILFSTRCLSRKMNKLNNSTQKSTTISNVSCGEFCRKKQNQMLLLSFMCIFVHLVVSLISVLLFPPFGTLDLFQCSVQQLEDFYAPLLSPSGCLYEVVYPLLSITVVYYFLSAISCAIIYSVIILCLLDDHHWSKYFYYSLYAYPVLSIMACLFGGLMYYLFPYTLIMIAIADSLYRFPLIFDYNSSPYSDSIPRPAFDCCTVVKHVCLNPGPFILPILINCSCVGYAVIAYFETINWQLIVCVGPILFYLSTLSLTHPLSNNRDCVIALQRLMDHSSRSSVSMKTRNLVPNPIIDLASQPDEIK